MNIIKPIKNLWDDFTQITISTLIRSTLYSFILILLPGILILNNLQARQLVLLEIKEDPIVTTFFVYLVGLLNIFIYAQKQRQKQKQDKTKEETLIGEAGVIVKFLMYFTIVFPLLGWLFILLIYKESLATVSVSLIFSALFLADTIRATNTILLGKPKKMNFLEDFLLVRIPNLLKFFTNHFKHKNPILEDNSLINKDFLYYRLKHMLFWAIIIALICNLINYEFPSLRLNFLNCIGNFFGIKSGFTNFDKNENSWLSLAQILISSIIIVILYNCWYSVKFFLIPRKKNWFTKWGFDFICILLAFIAITFLSFAGTIQGFDVIILFTLVVRFWLFLVSLSFIILFSPIKKEDEKYKILSASTSKFLSAILLLFSIWFVLDLCIFSSEKERKLYEFKTTKAKSSRNFSLDDAIQNRMVSSDSTQPILLVLGQGGGSRAGATMFKVLSNLDSAGLGNNILSIISISGSSNGAGFYLDAKWHNRKSEKINNTTEKLYNFDYITPSLFKMLFTDLLFTQAPWIKATCRKNRNETLMALESQKSKENTQSKGSILDSAWSSVYNLQNPHFPVFIPVTYNISKSTKAVSSPYRFDLGQIQSKSTFYSILDTLYDKQHEQEITIGQSISLSEMFPFISASANLKLTNSCKNESFMDGGVYDNVAFEIGDMVYNAVAKLRDSLYPKRPIVIITAENGKIDQKIQEIKNELDASVSSALNSIFTSNVISHLENLTHSINLAKDKRDTLLRVFSYNTVNPEKKSTCDIKSIMIDLKTRLYGDSTTITMSRFLTKKEIARLNTNIDRQMKQKVFPELKRNETK